MKYIVLSPDGFAIHPFDTYNSQKAAKAALTEWTDRYKPQGYYSTVIAGERVRIPLDELSRHCTIFRRGKAFNRILTAKHLNP